MLSVHLLRSEKLLLSSECLFQALQHFCGSSRLPRQFVFAVVFKSMSCKEDKPASQLDLIYYADEAWVFY